MQHVLESRACDPGQLRYAAVHRIQLLRAELLHFVGTLHDYIMTRVLMPAWKTLEERLDSAAGVDDIRRAHDEYVHFVGVRCLLQGKAKLLMQSVLQLLELSVELDQREAEAVMRLSGICAWSAYLP